MRNTSFIIGALILGSSASAATRLPRPDRDQLQAMVGKVGDMQERVNSLMAEAGGNVLEEDSRARRHLLEFSQRLERLTDRLNEADANWNNDSAYGQSVKNSCLETRRLFLSNSEAQRAAGEPSVGGIRPDNTVFSDSRIDVKDIRDTIFCEVYERAIENHSPWSHSRWNSSYKAGGQQVSAQMEMDGNHGSYKTSGFTGQFDDVIYFNDHVSAHWQVGHEGGWLEMPIQHGSFNGFWGKNELGSQIGGEWSGRQN